jgi:molecular chaperone DnaK (HSP70)
MAPPAAALTFGLDKEGADHTILVFDSAAAYPDVELIRAKFQEITKHLLDRCRVPFDQAIKDAGSPRATSSTSSRW